MIIAVTKDYRLRAREDVIHWKAVPGAGEVAVYSVTSLPNGTLLAAGTDGRLYTRATLSDGWRRVPVPAGEDVTVRSTAALPDGDIVGVDDTSHKLCYKNDGLAAPWMINSKDRYDISLWTVAAGPYGRIFGISYDDHYVYQRYGVDDTWKLVSDNERMHSVAELPDGNLIGIDEFGQMLVLGLDKRWAEFPIGRPGGKTLPRDMTLLPDGGILAVSGDGDLYTCPRPPAVGWRPMGLGMPLRAITALPDGTFVGVDTEGFLHKNTERTATSWQKMSYPYPLLAVTATDRLIGVGADNWVYQWDDLDAAPLMWETSRGVRGVTVLPDASVIGVSAGYLNDPDFQLHVRTWRKNSGRPGHTWVWAPLGRDPVDVQAVTSLPDGRLVAAGVDKRLYVRDGVSGAWREVPGGGGVTWVSALPDGSLLGIGEDQQAYVWPDFQPPTWSARPLRDGLELRAASAGPNGTLLGVARTGQLCLIDKADGDWTDVSGGVELLDVTTMADGSLLGVTSGTADNLMSRATLNDPWLPVRSNSAVKAVTTMPDGSLLGIGYSGQLSTRADLASDWHLVPDSGTVISASLLADGTILAVGQDGRLYTRTSLVGGAWQLVPDTSGGTENSGLSAVAILPDDLLRPADGRPLPISRRPQDWLLEFTAADVRADDGDGRPWGDGTAMARRAWAGAAPWDHGCMVTPMVGGFDALGAIREAFEAAIADAGAQSARGVPPGERGHVYITDWLLNGLRDLSETNPWRGKAWDVKARPDKDQTALGLILRMMSAGIVVRVLLWMPTSLQATQLAAHAAEHWSMAAAVQDHNARLAAKRSSATPLGVVALDLRTAYTAYSPSVASLHQKMIVVRVGSVNVGFCGGVDLAFTRRDFGGHGRAALGDWQSGTGSPPAAGGWPQQASLPPVGYPGFPYDATGEVNKRPFPEDLPSVAYGGFNRHWHDQHLKLEGPVVAALEDQFAERWIISPTEAQDWSADSRVYVFDRTKSVGHRNQVQLTAGIKFNTGGQIEVVPLPETRPVDPVSGVVVQMWRTIPMYPTRILGPFTRGEFTVMAGVAKAVAQARHLITIWDQYFWSTPLAKLLAARLNACPTLRLLIALPPYGTSNPAKELGLRRAAMQELWNDLEPANRSRVLVLNMWDAAAGVGVYVHDKVQTYDDALLVCGSANMNRRSFEDDAELDCAVLHAPTVRGHLARLYAGLAGQAWTDFGPGWFTRYWAEFILTEDGARWCDAWFIEDPFFRPNDAIGSPTLPNRTKIPTSSDWTKPDWIFDPTCFDSDLTTPDRNLPDPAMAGRLDGVTYLIERYHQGKTWPRRVAQHGLTSPPSSGDRGEVL